MRQAKPDDVFQFVSRATIRELWPSVQRYLGKTRNFWSWLLASWDRQERGGAVPPLASRPSEFSDLHKR